MKKIKTKDGSYTYHNKEYDETYHSTSGAIEESFEKFAKPAKLKNHQNVLDICFGLGYNSLAALSLAHVHIIALENNQNIIDKIEQNNISETDIHIEHNGKLISFETIQKNYNNIKKAIKTNNKEEIELIIGDARKTIQTISGIKFDAVFLDPFSPKKCPELWTKEFFADIYKIMKQDAVLTTYSCAKIVRNNLEAVGFTVTDGPIVGRRSPATIAYKKEIAKIQTSTAASQE